MEKRLKVIMKTSIVGILVNVLLAGLKVIVGSFSHSIAIIMDGVNNMADAMSSLITMIGAAIAGKRPDKKHPFGYGRIEYVTSLIIGGLVLYAGVSSFVESVKSIIHPEKPDYAVVTLVLIAVALVVKLMLAFYTIRQGEATHSDSLIGSGKECRMDAVVSFGTLAAALVFMFTGIGLEPYLAAIVALIIIKAAVELLMETLSKILGEPAEIEDVIAIKRTVNSFDAVHGVFDLILHNYGPDRYTASMHVEVDEGMTAAQFDDLTREIVDKVAEENGVIVQAVGLYSRNKTREEQLVMEKSVRKIAADQKGVLSMHGFYANPATKKMRFDLVVSLDVKDREGLFAETVEKIRALYPEYKIKAAMDMDMSEAVRKNER